MAYYPPSVVKDVKQIDLLSYLEKYNPDELVKISNGNYQTVSHDSLKISNGMWYWFSEGRGGNSALEYLIQVESKTFLEAMEVLTDYKDFSPSVAYTIEEIESEFEMPKKSSVNSKAINYLLSREIDLEIINYCIDNELIFQEEKTNNVGFVGYDNNIEKYVSLRGTTDKKFFKEAKGSNKAHAFKLISDSCSNEVHLFEGAIDLLSYATILKMYNKNWYEYNLISLAGVYKPKNNSKESELPPALELFLNSNKNISKIHMHFDNDYTGKCFSNYLKDKLSNQYDVKDSSVSTTKDVNEFLVKLIKSKQENVRER